MLFTASLLACLLAPVDGTRFEVGGDVEKTATWDVPTLEREFARQIQTIQYTLHDEPHEARCIPLRALIDHAQPRPATDRRNPMLAFAVVVQGDDGYTACFSMSELLGDRAVYIAIDRDGEPLPDGDRPVRLIVPSEARPARWVFGIESIQIVDTAGILARPAR